MLVQNIKRSQEEFLGQVAVVTGSSSGIGKAIASALAVRSAALCLVGRDLERLEKVAKGLGADKDRLRCYTADLAQDQDILVLKEQIQRDFGQIDILIHSAGVISIGKLKCAPLEDFDWQYQINVRAAYFLTQCMLPLLRAARGQIVFLNSTAGTSARSGSGQYAATKHALKALANSLRDEVNKEGIRILSVFLGRTASPMQEFVHRVEGRPYYPGKLVQPEDVASVVINALSLPRTAEVTDIHIRPFIKSD